MFYRKILFISFFVFLNSCSSHTLKKNNVRFNVDNSFTNKGFALVYNKNLYDKKIISKKLDLRSLLIFQKNLKRNTTVKVTNLINSKSLIAKVGSNSLYPSFNNSVISPRVAKELELNTENPYIEIKSITTNSIFIAKRAKTYEEEKQVAGKAPVKGISISDLKNKTKKIDDKNITKFSYKIKIADFYYKKSALLLIERIKNETIVKNPKFQKLSERKYRVYLGPFDHINSLKKKFSDISILEFENVEIIKND